MFSSAGGKVEKMKKDRRNDFNEMKKEKGTGRKLKKQIRGKNHNYDYDQ